jgi:hypothetical protein
MLNMWSQLDEAWRTTLVHAATGKAFRRLARWFGFVYQNGILEGSWRRALLELAQGKRGTKTTTFDVLRHVFRQYDTLIEVEVDPAAPNTMTFVASPGLTAFDHTHVGRYISTPYGVMWSAGPVLCGGVGPATSPTLELLPHAAADWVAPAWPFTTPTRFTVRVLPFLYYEMQPQPVDRSQFDTAYYPGDHCRIDVYFLGGVVPLVPTTYLQDADDSLTPAGVPYGGNLLDDVFTPGDPLGAGPHPLYLVDDTAFGGIRDQVQRTLVAGVEIRFFRAYTYPCS